MSASNQTPTSVAAGDGNDGKSAQAPLKPGDEAAPGTPGSGESLCPRCGGSGRVEGQACTDCAGTGKVTRGIGGA